MCGSAACATRTASSSRQTAASPLLIIHFSFPLHDRLPLCPAAALGLACMLSDSPKAALHGQATTRQAGAGEKLPACPRAEIARVPAPQPDRAAMKRSHAAAALLAAAMALALLSTPAAAYPNLWRACEGQHPGAGEGRHGAPKPDPDMSFVLEGLGKPQREYCPGAQYTVSGSAAFEQPAAMHVHNHVATSSPALPPCPHHHPSRSSSPSTRRARPS